MFTILISFLVGHSVGLDSSMRTVLIAFFSKLPCMYFPRSKAGNTILLVNQMGFEWLEIGLLNLAQGGWEPGVTTFPAHASPFVIVLVCAFVHVS